MVTKQERDKIIERIVRLLYREKVNGWSVQDRGVLLAAIKLQLREPVQNDQEEGAE